MRDRRKRVFRGEKDSAATIREAGARSQLAPEETVWETSSLTSLVVDRVFSGFQIYPTRVNQIRESFRSGSGKQVNIRVGLGVGFGFKYSDILYPKRIKKLKVRQRVAALPLPGGVRSRQRRLAGTHLPSPSCSSAARRSLYYIPFTEGGGVQVQPRLKAFCFLPFGSSELRPQHPHLVRHTTNSISCSYREIHELS